MTWSLKRPTESQHPRDDYGQAQDAGREREDARHAVVVVQASACGDVRVDASNGIEHPAVCGDDPGTHDADSDDKSSDDEHCGAETNAGRGACLLHGTEDNKRSPSRVGHRPWQMNGSQKT